jgi:hypothetical protein
MKKVFQPKDGVGSAPYTHYSADYNVGESTIHTGGGTAFRLLLPVIPRTWLSRIKTRKRRIQR